MKFSLATTFVVLAAGADITLDKGKLTDFTADFTASAKDVPFGYRAVVLAQAELNGRLQLNLFDEKLKFTYTGKETWDKNAKTYLGSIPPAERMLMTGLSGASGEIVIDGPAGEATIREKGTVAAGPAGFDGEYCVHLKVPKGLLPPGSMLKMDVDRGLPMVQEHLNDMPHTVDETGDVTFTKPISPYVKKYHYPHQEASFTLQTDGTPVSYHSKFVCDDVCMEDNSEDSSGIALEEVSVTVKDWTAGAGDVTPVACVDSSVADLSAHPEVMRAAAVFDVLMGQFAGSSGLKVPSLTPLLEQQMFLVDNVKTEPAQQQSWTVALFAGVAGMAGGAVVLALDKAFKRREPLLLSEA